MRSYPVDSAAVKRLPSIDATRAPLAAVRTGLALSIVVPVYNLPDDRLSSTLVELNDYRRTLQSSSELILVDDGSNAETAARLAVYAEREPGVRLLRNPVNRGKGYAVVRGLMAAQGEHRVFTDADLAYPADQIDNVVRTLNLGFDIAIACRVLPESRYEMSPAFFRYLYSRHVMSRFFNAVVRVMLIPGILDSQAGLKGLTAAATMRLAPLMTVEGFAFDVELLYAAYLLGLHIGQMPVSFRYDSEPTTMHFLRDAVGMFADCVRIRRNAARGRYG